MSTRPEDYDVAWVCAVEIERVVARAILDEEYVGDRAPRIASSDHNSYTFGRISQHNVVIACLPHGRYGITSAAIVATHIQMSFPAIQIRLMVGIAGGAPSDKHDIRLGDVVVSSPTPGFSGVLQYDFGKTVQKQDFEMTGFMNSPPDRLLNAVGHMKAQHKADGYKIKDIIIDMLEKNPRLVAECRRPVSEQDRLYKSDYAHSDHGDCVCNKIHDPEKDGNESYHQFQVLGRSRRQDEENPIIHYGLVASASSLMKDAILRDALIEKCDVLCFEMEAAGLMNSFPCLIIRGICDYSDSHKNKVWQGYAAATAAAYAKELLEFIRARSKTIVQGVPLPKRFISRPTEMEVLEESLLPRAEPSSVSSSRQIFALRGLGGIGKTQLAVEFMRSHKTDFTAIFWIDGSSQDNLKRDLASNLKRIPSDQISIPSRNYAESGEVGLDTAVREILAWLAKPLNNKWLLVFDNIDRDFDPFNPSRSVEQDPLSYDIMQFLPKADHGSILITTRLTRLERLGESREVRKVDEITANNILKSWYKRAIYGKRDGFSDLCLIHQKANGCADEAEVCQLLGLLDGLPLAIAQAGAYLQETGISIKDYLQLYDQRQGKIARFISGENHALLNDYSGRSLWTTWIMSYDAVMAQNKYAANMLIFWSFLDRNGLWYGLFQRLSDWPSVLQALSQWLGDIVSDRLSFTNAMRLLRGYSLIEGSDSSNSYSMHAVVHRWIYLYQGIHRQSDVGALAFATITLAAPSPNERDHNSLQQRLFPHAQSCRDRVFLEQASTEQGSGVDLISDSVILPEREEVMAGAWNGLGMFYFGQSKHVEAEQAWKQALEDYEKVAGEEDPRTLVAVQNLGTLCREQGRLLEAEQFFMRALQGRQQALGDEHVLTLEIVHNLGIVYREQDQLTKAEQMFLQVLQGREQALGPEHTSTLDIANSLGILYGRQGRLNEAEEMLTRALRGEEKVLGADHFFVSNTINNLALLYEKQGKLDKAEQSYIRALQGYERLSGAEQLSMSRTAHNLGDLYLRQGKLEKAEQMLQRASHGYEIVHGPEHTATLSIVIAIAELYRKQDKQDMAEQMYVRALEGYAQGLGNEHSSTLEVVNSMGSFYREHGRFAEAEQMFKRGLNGYEKTLGSEAVKTHAPALQIFHNLGNLYWKTNRWPEAKVMYERALVGFREVEGASSVMCIQIEQYLSEGPIDTSDEDRNSAAAPVESNSPTEENRAEKKRRIAQKLKIQQPRMWRWINRASMAIGGHPVRAMHQVEPSLQTPVEES